MLMSGRGRVWVGRAAGVVALCIASAPLGAARAEELIAAKSPVSVDAVLDRVQTFATANGFFVVARVDHSGAAAGAGLALRPTKLLIFGNPKGGTPLMQCDQRVAVDLPLKALAWQDDRGQVWLGMADPAVLKTRYGLPPACDLPLAAVGATVHRIVETITKP